MTDYGHELAFGTFITPRNAPPEGAVALAHGFSTFILGSDDGGDIERFGSEVAPAVRAAVARERAGRGGTSAAEALPGRPAA